VPFALGIRCASGASEPLESDDAGEAARRSAGVLTEARVGTSTYTSLRGVVTADTGASSDADGGG
jgi:hypothetical protein